MHKRQLQKIKFRKSDRLRAILTDTLPYEVPLLFSNEGLYRRIKREIPLKFYDELQLSIFKPIGPTIPYVYKIKKNASEFRQLAIMHPKNQQPYAEFYANYESLITALCQRSVYTLRSPIKVASHYVEKARSQRKLNGATKNVEHNKSGFELTSRTASSYFAYSRYGLIHKFYDSTEFHSLEKKFRYLLRLDISQCFNRIYTHSLSWAIKNKEFAKADTSPNTSTFDKDFDRLMRNANYGETIGILIGPEASRIFAELILQRIDLDTQRKLLTYSLREGHEYSIRRYVDDYFVFTNDIPAQELIHRVLADHLAEYKLHFNSSKTVAVKRPFFTSEAAAKVSVAETASDLFDKHTHLERIEDPAVTTAGGDSAQEKITKVLRVKYISDPQRAANAYIRDLKRAVGSNGLTFEVISNYFFGVVKRKLAAFVDNVNFQDTDDNYAHRVNRFLLVVLDIVFFVYAMTPRVRQTYQIAEVILSVSDLLSNAPNEVRESLTRKIVDDATSIISTHCVQNDEDNIELLNLLIALRSLGTEYMYGLSFLEQVFCKKRDNGEIEFEREKFGYFQIVTLLHYIQDESQYTSLLEMLMDFVESLYKNDEKWEQKSELCCLMLDYVRCPYIPTQRKMGLAKYCLRHISDKNLNSRATRLIEIIQDGDWFFSWDKKHNLSELLLRKELRTPY